MSDQITESPIVNSMVDTLYEIALDPSSLDRFINTWNEAGLDSHAARQMITNFDQFDQAYQTHLARADTFLKRGIDTEDPPDLLDTLVPFENLAAFIIDSKLRVVVANEGAQNTFGIQNNTSLEEVEINPEAKVALINALHKTLSTPKPSQHLLKMTDTASPSPEVFQIRQLETRSQDGHTLALVVTTNYHWNETLGEMLEEVFELTQAEQKIVRLLVEGKSTKDISKSRGTSEATVRGQIKTILGKMNARTQSEIIRLVLNLRDVSSGTRLASAKSQGITTAASHTWWRDEVWKPFQQITLPDGRNMQYHIMGPPTGVPVFYTHMGYCMARWHEPMIRLLYDLNLRVICPLRPGFGLSDNLDPKANLLEAIKNDTLFLLQHLGIKRCPYLTQGNDLMFAAHFAANYPEVVSEIIGICAKPPLKGDQHYAGMGKWHRFFMSTARHAPHLLNFTTKAAVSLARRIGIKEIFFQVHQGSPADMAMGEDEHLKAVLISNGELLVSKETDGAQAYAMEMLVCENPWEELLISARNTKTWFMNADQDPVMDVATIAVYRETYPWIKIEVVPNTGQLLLYQNYEALLPRVAAAAMEAQREVS